MLAARMNPRPKSHHRAVALNEQAAALNVVLRKEFGVPFVFYHALTGHAVQDATVKTSDSWRAWMAQHPETALAPDDVLRLAADTKPEVTVLADGRYQMTLVFYDGTKPLVVAAGLFAGLAKSREETEREQAWLTQWVQSVSERLRLTEQVQRQVRATEDQHQQARTAWEGLLAFDHVLRRLRIHKEPVRNRQRILDTANRVLGTQALAWVPEDSQAAVLIAGELCLTPGACRQLVAELSEHPDLVASGHLLCNEAQSASWATAYPSLRGLMVFALPDGDSPGWVIALNKQAAAEPVAHKALDFRSGDAALLTPFVGLLKLHASASNRYHDLKDLMVGLARSLTAAIDAKDSYTYGHSERVARIAVELGRQLGLEGDDLSDLYLGGLLHDVGKIGIRDAVLRKVDPLTPEEFDHIKQHVLIGYTILSDLKPIRNILGGVLYHHERWDGAGYPEGLAGDAIPLLARVIAVADAYDAMSTCRSYREAIPLQEVEARLEKGAGTQWDSKVIEAFLASRQKVHVIRQRGVGDSLRLALDAALRSSCAVKTEAE